MFTNKKLTGSILLLLICVLGLGACSKPIVNTPDPNAKITEVAMTVQAELTRIALLTPSPTPTEVPTATPTATATLAVTPTEFTITPLITQPFIPTAPAATSTGLDDAKWVADIGLQDGDPVKPGTVFTKTWRVLNTGKTTWTKTYRLLYLEGLLGKDNKAEVLLGKEVKPGEQIDISVVFLAPQTNGTQTGYWKLYNDQGYIFGEVLSMKVVVTDNPDAFKTPTPTK